MKKFLLKFLTTVLFIGVLSNAYAGTYVAKATGSWKDASNWSGPNSNYIPTTGDIAIIPSGVTITYTIVDTNPNLGLGHEAWANPTIYVYGTLDIFSDVGTYNGSPKSEGPLLTSNLNNVIFFSGGKLIDDDYSGIIYTGHNNFYFNSGSSFVVGTNNAYSSSVFLYDNAGPGLDDPSVTQFTGTTPGPFTIVPSTAGVAPVFNATAPPSQKAAVVTAAASSVAGFGATLNGRVYSTNLQTTGVIFRYGTVSDLSTSSTVAASTGSVNGNTSNTTLTASLSGLTSGQTYYYRIEGTNTVGTTLGDIQTFTVPCTAPTVTANPPNRTICLGSNTTFRVSGTNITATQWQVDTGSGTFTDLTDAGVYSGTTTTTLTINGATAAMSGYKYRAKLTDGVGACVTLTNAGTLTVSHMTFNANAVTNVSCFGGNNGSASVNVITNTGIAPYTYSWSPGGQTNQFASGLAAGTYTVTVTDNIGCTANQIVVINQPAAPITPVASVTQNVTTHGGNNGATLASASGGTPDYTYEWSNGSTDPAATGLIANTYTILITDANGCTASKNVTVFEPAATPTATAATSTGFTANWAAESGATGYQLDVSADNFSTFVTGYNNLSVAGTSQVITGLSAGITYSYRVRYVINSVGTSPNSAIGTQVLDTPPAIAGTISLQSVNDNATIDPFGGVVITDPETAQIQTVTVAIDDAAKGTFTTLNGFTNAGGGLYTFSGTATDAQTAIRGLVFTPTPNHVPHGGTEISYFTITVNDGIADVVTDKATSVISISVNDKPVIAGSNTISYNALDAATLINPSVTVSDPEDSRLQSITVAITGGFMPGDILAADGISTSVYTSYDETTGILTLTDGQNMADFQTVLQSVTYYNPSSNPTSYGRSPSREISYTANDGDLLSDVVKSTVNITASSDATLSALVLSNGTLSPDFSGSTTAYTASTANTSINITATKSNADALLQIQLNGGGYTDLTSGTASSDLSLAAGGNTIDVQLTALDGTVKTYTITVSRKTQPVITQQPSTGSQAVFVGAAPAPLTVAASGGSGFTYQWYSNATASNTGGTPISLPVGTNYGGAGGIVGYILQPADPGYVAGQLSGIIVAPTDAGNGAEWGCQGTSVSTSFNIGSGLANTNAMITSCTTPGTAAQLAHAYTANGFSDWYLPSYNEMNQFYIHRAVIGGFANTGYYWTSSQFNGSEAYGAGFDNGDNGLGHGTKSDGDRVRAARSFNIADKFAPLSATAATTYYYVVVTNSDGLSATSEVSGPVAVTAKPIIAVTGTIQSLNTTYGTASGNATLSVNANNLTADLAITAPSGFEISTDETSGFANSLALTPTNGTVATQLYIRLAGTIAAGPYNGNVNFTSTNADEFDLSASGVIVPEAVTVTADEVTKVFGTADPALTYTVTSGALFNGDMFSGALVRNDGDNVGDYSINQNDLSLSNNYVLTYAGANLKITNATLIGPTLTDASFTYDGTPKSLTVDGVPDGATVTYSGNEQINSGSFSVRATVSLANYDDLQLAAVITVNNADFTGITLPTATFTYDGTAKGLKVIGLPDGATADFNNNDQTDDGNYSVTATISQANYNNLTLTSALNILPATFTGITLAPATFGYDSASKSLAIAGAPDDATVAYTNNGQSNAGVYNVTVAISKPHYTTLTLNADLTINPMQVTVTSDPQNKIYGTNDADLTYTVSPALIGSDGFTGTLSRADAGTLGGEQVGLHAIAQGSLAASSNYQVSFVDSGFYISPALVFVKADTQTKAYGMVDPTLTYNVTSGLVNASVDGLSISDNASVFSGVLSRDAGELVSSYSILQGSLSAGSNYIVVFDGNNFTITPTIANEAQLASLVSSVGMVSKVSNTAYAITVSGLTVNKLHLRPTATNPQASLTVNGSPVVSGAASADFAINTGSTPTIVPIVIVAQDGVTTNTVQVTVNHLASSNADLSSLTISGGIVATQTGPTQFAATVTATQAMIRGALVDAGATFKINGAAILPGVYTSNISLVTGANVIPVMVTAEDGTTKTYTLTITKLPSANADLKSLTLGGGIVPTQASATQFTANIASSQVTVRAIVTDAIATVKINGVSVASGIYSGNINLALGANTIPVVITAEDGTTIKTYTLTVTRLASSNTDLKSLAASGQTPTQITATTYSTRIAGTTVTVRATPVDINASVKINGVSVASGVYSDNINLTLGANTIPVIITAEDGTTIQSYSLAVIRLASSNTDLKSLAVSGQTPTQTTATTFTASIAASQVTVRATATDANATVQINGTPVVSGAYSGNINLALGANTITTVITAEDGTTKTYTLTVTRVASSNADLKSLALNGGVTVTQTTPTTYTATVTATQVTVRPTVADAKATVKVNGTPVTSGLYSGSITLTTGTNTVTTVVTAEDGTTKTYTLTITRQQSSNADLKSVALNGGIVATQASATIYTATTTATQVLVRAAVANANATLKINGTAVASNVYSGSIPLTTGTNTVIILVTAEDGTTKTDTLTITRQQSSNTDLKALVLGGGVTVTQLNATIYVANVTTPTVSVRAVAADVNAKVAIGAASSTQSDFTTTVAITGYPTTIPIGITAEDGTVNIYTLYVSNNSQSSLAATPVAGVETLSIPAPNTIVPANILSPNGDGKNDTWIIKDIDYYPANEVTIYDHTGKVVFTKKGYSNEWDGTFNGAPLPQGTYYYILKLSPTITPTKGFISILRSN